MLGGNTRERDGKIFYADCDEKANTLKDYCQKSFKVIESNEYGPLLMYLEFELNIIAFSVLKTYEYLPMMIRVILSRAYGATSRCGWDCQLVTSLFK